MRPNLKFHNGATCDAAAVAANFNAHSKSLLTGPALTPISVDRGHQPHGGHHHHEDAVGAVQLLPVRRHRQPSSPSSPSPTWLATGSQTNPVGTGPFIFQRVGPEQPLHRQPEPELLAHRDALPGQHHLQADSRPRPDPGQPQLGRDRHPPLRHGLGHHPDAEQHVAGLHRRLHARGRRARHGLHPAQHAQGPVQQRQDAPGHGLRHQLRAVRQGDRQRGEPARRTASSPPAPPTT